IQAEDAIRDGHVPGVQTHPLPIYGAQLPQALPLEVQPRPAMLDTVRGGRARLYFQRQSLWELGPVAEAWLTELIHRRPAQWRHRSGERGAGGGGWWRWLGAVEKGQ